MEQRALTSFPESEMDFILLEWITSNDNFRSSKRKRLASVDRLAFEIIHDPISRLNVYSVILVLSYFRSGVVILLGFGVSGIYIPY